MAYTLQAILGRAAEMRSAAPADLPTVSLTDGFALWAIDSDFQDAHSIPFLPLTSYLILASEEQAESVDIYSWDAWIDRIERIHT